MAEWLRTAMHAVEHREVLAIAARQRMDVAQQALAAVVVQFDAGPDVLSKLSAEYRNAVDAYRVAASEHFAAGVQLRQTAAAHLLATAPKARGRRSDAEAIATDRAAFDDEADDDADDDDGGGE